ncbi:MAG: hypothetical protein UMR38_08015 [Candidatus Izemoplasma sp.]|nr:hypothetical protein [Candidatus Izemoplasma sp.]
MKGKVLGGIILILIIIVTLLLFIQEERPLQMMSRKQVISMYETNSYETFRISVLTNDPNSFHFDEDYISRIALVNGDEKTRVEIDKIMIDKQQLLHQDTVFTVVHFDLRPLIHLDDGQLIYDDASLEITYRNDTTYYIPVGEVNYVFTHDAEPSLSLGGLSATIDTYDKGSRVSGLYIELGNLTYHNILIKDIDIMSVSVKANTRQLKEVYTPVEYTDCPSDILGLASYDLFQTYVPTELRIQLLSQTSKAFYVPLVYNASIEYIERFTVKVTYEIDGTEKTQYIDDFPFIRQPLFHMDNTDDWIEIDDPISD